MAHFDGQAGVRLKQAFDEAVDSWPGVAGKPMFGCPSYTADGTLFAVLVTDAVVLTHLDAERRAALAEQFPVEQFEANGRTVAAWAQVPVDDPTALDGLLPFVRESYETAHSGTTDAEA